MVKALTSKEKQEIVRAYNREVPEGERFAYRFLTFKKYALDNPEEFRELLRSYGPRSKIHTVAEETS
jgi:hypothetical protein